MAKAEIKPVSALSQDGRLITRPNRLVGLVVKEPALREEEPVFESHLRRDFSEKQDL